MSSTSLSSSRTSRHLIKTPKPAFVMTTRYRLLLGGICAVLLSLLVIRQTGTAYTAALDTINQIGTINSVVVDASEHALEALAATSQAAADHLSLAMNSPLGNERLAASQDHFAYFRAQMFTLRSQVQTSEERSVIDTIETATYNRFWLSMGALLSAKQRGDEVSARVEYLSIEAQLTNPIVPTLQQLETLNYQQMVSTGEQANALINTQVFLLAIPILGLAGLLTSLSFWVRRTLRRYLTPGFDAAMIIAWVLAVVMLTQILSVPRSLQIMISDAYRSISASSRILVDANLANRAESSALLDVSHTEAWIQTFNEASMLIELRLCGVPGCTAQPFFKAGTTDTVDPLIEQQARAISPDNSARIGGVIPLIGNVTFAGEVATLEHARQMYLSYQQAHKQLQQYLAAGDLAGAVEFNTGSAIGQSEAAFQAFVDAISQERAINRVVFDVVWMEQSVLLPRHQIVLGVMGYLLVIVLVGGGMWHRFREL
jgi:hypothetical protein